MTVPVCEASGDQLGYRAEKVEPGGVAPAWTRTASAGAVPRRTASQATLTRELRTIIWLALADGNPVPRRAQQQRQRPVDRLVPDAAVPTATQEPTLKAAGLTAIAPQTSGRRQGIRSSPCSGRT